MRGRKTERLPDLFGEPVDNSKTCTQCGLRKKLESFSTNGVSSKTGRKYVQAECRACKSERHKAWRAKVGKARAKRSKIKWTYGISYEEHAALLASQNGKCAICGDTEMPIDPRTKKPYELALDHDHATGKVRAFLCPNCNIGLGGFRDDPVRLQAAISYLAKHKSAEIRLA